MRNPFDYTDLFRKMGGFERSFGYQHWAKDIQNRGGRFVASGAAEAVDRFGNWSTILFCFIAAVIFESLELSARLSWDSAQNSTGGNNTTDVSDYTNVSRMFILAMVFVGVGLAATLVRGYKWLYPKQPNSRPFKNYLGYLTTRPVVTEADVDLKKAITDPHNEGEAQQFLSWHKGFIDYVLNLSKYQDISDWDVSGDWAIVGGMLRSLSDHFPFQFTGKRDLYNTPLLLPSAENPSNDKRKNVEEESQDNLLRSASPDVSQADSFYTADIQAKKEAAKADWQTMRTNPQTLKVEPHTLAMCLASHVQMQLRQRSGTSKTAARALYRVLNAVIMDPLDTTKTTSKASRTFITELASNAFLLVNLLRPAIDDGQWAKWSYFYARDEVVTEAFKQLSPKQQAWMIFTLMSGNDQGKLLALSILQDPRFALTARQGPALNTFFEAYLDEFGGISKARATALYQDVYSKAPNEAKLDVFRTTLDTSIREQLVWLTNNATGRMKVLFEKDDDIAAKLLRNFTVDPPENATIQSGYSVPPSKSSESNKPKDKDEPHPWEIHAQALLWSISNPGQQKRICRKMEFDDKTKGIKGARDSSKALFRLDHKDNIDAIKEGALLTVDDDKIKKGAPPSASLDLLLPRLLSGASQPNAFLILARLLSDPEHGIIYQRGFQALVKSNDSLHDDGSQDGSNDDHEAMAKFRYWLYNNADALIGQKAVIAVRARYAAAMLTVIMTGADTKAIQASKLDRMIATFYPEDDVLTALHLMHAAFYETDEEWTLRGDILRCVLGHRAPASHDLVEGHCAEYLSQSKQGSLLVIIGRGLKGNIDRDKTICAQVKSWGTLLRYVIHDLERRYPTNTAYLDKIIERYCEAIEERYDSHFKLNLALVLMEVLDSSRQHSTAEVAVKRVYQVFTALKVGLENLKSSSNPSDKITEAERKKMFSIDSLSNKLQKLGPQREVKADVNATKVDIVPSHFEPLCLHMALYLLAHKPLQQQEAFDMLADIFGRQETFAHTTPTDRKNIATCLNKLVKSKDTNMKSRVLLLLFKDPDKLNMLEYAAGFLAVCDSVGIQGAAAGLGTLIAGIQADRFLTGHFSSAVKPVVMRMIAVALYAEYQQHKNIASNRGLFQGGAQTTRSGAINKMTAILTQRDAVEKADIVYYNVKNDLEDLKTAFSELAMSSAFKDIRQFIDSENGQVSELNNVSDSSASELLTLSSTSESEDIPATLNPDERTPLNVDSVVIYDGAGTGFTKGT